MKFKTLRYKKEFNQFQEFVIIEEVGGEPMVFTSATPKLQPETANLEEMKKFFEENDYYEGLEFDWDKVELVELLVIEPDEVGADIRNKLTPPQNLVRMLEEFFTEPLEPSNNLDRMRQNDFIRLIKKEMIQTKENIKYIGDLL